MLRAIPSDASTSKIPTSIQVQVNPQISITNVHGERRGGVSSAARYLPDIANVVCRLHVWTA